MTYGRVLHAEDEWTLDGAAVSHSTELVRGPCLFGECPLIRPSAAFSPCGR